MTSTTRIRRAVRAAAAVPLRDWPEVARILAVLGFVEVSLRVGNLPRLARRLGVPLQLDPIPLGTPMVQLPSPRARRRLELTRAVLFHLYRGPTCLKTSLVAGNRLRQLKPRLRIGVNRDNSKLAAHAWLEIDGQYFDPQATTYLPTASVGE